MILLNWTITEDPPPLSKRAMRELTRDGFREVGQMWQREMLPDHFDPSRQRKYKFRRRGSKYIERKRRDAERDKARKGGRALLVRSGLMEQLLEREQRVRAFPTRATVMIPGPRYVSMRPRGNRPNLGAEATAVTSGETKRLAKRFDEHVTQQLNQRRGTKTTKV